MAWYNTFWWYICVEESFTALLCRTREICVQYPSPMRDQAFPLEHRISQSCFDPAVAKIVAKKEMCVCEDAGIEQTWPVSAPEPGVAPEKHVESCESFLGLFVQHAVIYHSGK